MAQKAAAAEKVRSLIDQIYDLKAAALATELTAAQELAWRLFDKLAGVLLIDERCKRSKQSTGADASRAAIRI